MKKTLALLLILALCLPLVAVSESQPVELSVVVCRRTTDTTESYSEKHWVQESEAACNVKINWIELIEGQTDEPLAAMLAGDLPDVLFMGNKVSDNLISQNAKLWQPITEAEIIEYCPNIHEVYEKYFPDWKTYMTYPDGNIYGLIAGSKDSPMNEIWGIQYINYQWLENLGLEVPTTLDEFYDVLLAFKEKDANLNGDPNDEIPLDFCNNHYAANIWTFASMWGIANGASKFYNIIDGEVTGTVNTPAFREFLEFFYKLGQDGLLNLEGFSQTQDQYNANLDALKVGVFWGYGPYNYIKSSAKLQYDAMLPVAAEGYNACVSTNPPIAARRNGFVITTACKNKEAALRWYDFLSKQPEAIGLFNGPEGILWKWIDKDNVLYENITYSTAEELNAAIADAFPELSAKGLDSTAIGNSIAYINNAPFQPYQGRSNLSDTTANGTRRTLAVSLYRDAGIISKPMNQAIVPSEAQEELDFMTDSLANVINGFVAESIINGVTDSSWDAFQGELERSNYSFYLDWYNKYLHNEL